ncbi:unnamed protein product [Mytilus coruscus]|uniref:FLYWCH-type domain-containing protein n=1 Tax=Mytilus coruscus TaxID=42192 RepID=A0A6J8DDV4_MYTCO|nr:unnamed protein product [Mytilus coruscus]
MSFPCAYCEKEVRPRQHAFECETCSCWQHRLCNTGVSLADYRRLMYNEVEMFFECFDAVEDEQPENERDIALVDALEKSLGPLSSEAADVSIPDLSFNISIEFDRKVVESDSDDSDDSDTSDSFIEDRPVTFEVVNSGTTRNAKKLVSSDGYSYTVKNATSRTINWRCSVRNKTISCKATVAQRGQNFIRGVKPHIHPNDPGVVKKTKIRAEVMTEAAAHAYKSAGDIVKEKMHNNISSEDFNLINPNNVTRAINRLRQERRLKEPRDLNLR